MSTSSKNRAAAFVDKLFEKYGEWRMKQVSLSWCLASPEERTLRLRTVMALSVELDRIKRINMFSTALGENCIEEVIQGNWSHAAEFIEHFTFEEEEPRRHSNDLPVDEDVRKLWEPFVILLRAACAEEVRIERSDMKGQPS